MFEIILQLGHLWYNIKSSDVLKRSNYHDITYGTAITVAESESDFRITTSMSYGVSIVRILETIGQL